MQAELNLPIDGEICFSDVKGKHRPRQQKKALKILARLAPLLHRILEPGEEIQFVTQGASPYSLLELLTTGRFIHLVKLCILVVTDRRILQLPAWSLYRPKSSVAEMRFADLSSVETKGLILVSLQLEYQDGSKDKFSAVQAGKKLAQCLDGRAGKGAPSLEPRRRHLCPRCAKALSPATSDCASCELAFKTEKKALLWSLLLPGGGYFYTGQRLLGIFDAAVEGVLLFGLLFALPTVGDGAPGSVALALGLLGLLALEKAITVYHANHAIKEFLPANPKQLASPPAAPSSAPAPAPGGFAAPLEP